MIRRFALLMVAAAAFLATASRDAVAQITISSPTENETFHSGNEICVDGTIKWTGTQPFGVDIRFDGVKLLGQIMSGSVQDPATGVWTGTWVAVTPHFVAPTVTARTQYSITAKQQDYMGNTSGTAATRKIWIDP